MPDLCRQPPVLERCLSSSSRPLGSRPFTSSTPAGTLSAARPPRPGRPAPSPWRPPQRLASRVLTATPGRARPPLRVRAARDAPRGRSGRPRGGGRAGRAGEVALPHASSFRHGRAEPLYARALYARARGDAVATWPAQNQPPRGLPRAALSPSLA